MGGRNVMPLFYASRATAARASRGKQLAAPMVSAAIRIPERMSAQLALVFPAASPQLFVHEGARQSLERRLMAAYPGPVALSITDNRHSIITHSCKEGVLRARIHHMFLDAPANVVEALVRYVTQGEREASALIGRYIEANGHRLARRSRNVVLHTKGKRHDLLHNLRRAQRALFQRRGQRRHHLGQTRRQAQGRPHDDQARKLQRRRAAHPGAPGARSEVGASLLRRLHRLSRDAAPRDPGEPRPREHPQHAPPTRVSRP